MLILGGKPALVLILVRWSNFNKIDFSVELLESFLLPPRRFVLIHWRLRFRAADFGRPGRKVAHYYWPANIFNGDYFLKYSKLWKPSMNFGERGKEFLNLESIICPFSPFWASKIIFKVLAWLGAARPPGQCGALSHSFVIVWVPWFFQEGGSSLHLALAAGIPRWNHNKCKRN